MNSRTQRRKNGYRYVRTWLLKAIVIENIDGRIVGRGPYHNVRDNNHCINKFLQKMKRLFPAATHVNFYDYKGNFVKQERYQVEKEVTRTMRRPGFNYFFTVTGYDMQYNMILLDQW